jgi:branched-chain amino acid transport system substrate-binding protein
MHRKVALACLALTAVLVISVPAASAGPRARAVDPGVTPTQILLGGTTPLSGTASSSQAVARGADAYFRFVNARCGVQGRRIVYRYLDDASNPAQAAEATRQLVEEEKVFAIINSLGTEQNLAVRDYLNGLRVPQLFVASGATTWGRDTARYPWTIGYQPSYQAEGRMYGTYLARTRPGARVAVLAEHDDFGKDLVTGLKRGLTRSRAGIVATQTYEATALDVQAQVAKLKASGADVLALFATPKFAVQAYVAANRLGWRPLVITTTASSASTLMALASEGGRNRTVDGSISATFLKDPTDPRWAKDPAMAQYRSIMARYAKGANVRDVHYVYGMAVAYTTVEVLKAAGRDLTRAAVMAKARALNSASNPFVLPGIKVETGARDGFPIEQAVLQRWSKGSWKSFGGVWG